MLSKLRYYWDWFQYLRQWEIIKYLMPKWHVQEATPCWDEKFFGFWYNFHESNENQHYPHYVLFHRFVRVARLRDGAIVPNNIWGLPERFR